MRIVALLIGFVAAALALGLPTVTGGSVVSQVGPMMAGLTGIKALALYGLYVPAGIALLGALLVLLSPASGAILLLISALIWFGMASLKPELFTVELLAPSGIALFAAIMAFVGGEIGSRRQSRQRDNRLVAREGFAPRTRALREPDFTPAAEEPAFEPVPAVPPFGEPEVDPAAAAARLAARRTGPARSAAAAAPRGTRRARFADDDAAPRRSRSLAPVLILLLLVIGGGAAYAVLGPLKLVDIGKVIAPAPDASVGAGAAKPADAKPADTAPAKANTSDTDASAAPAETAASGGFMDARAYCKAVTTIDRPDSRYTGEPFSEAMAARLKIPMSTSPDRVRWRCVDGQVLICASYAGPVCDQTPTFAEMQDFCKLHPKVGTLFAPAGIWSCVDGKPELPKDAKWPVDARGFFPPAWLALQRTVDAPAAATETAPAPNAADLLANPAPAPDPAGTDPTATGSTPPAVPAADAPADTTGGQSDGTIDPNKVAPVPATRPVLTNQPLNLGG